MNYENPTPTQPAIRERLVGLFKRREDGESMSKWVNLGYVCEHCGMQIESKPDYSSSIQLKGFESMHHRHAHNKSSDCVITTTHRVHPYSSAGMRDKYYKEATNEE